MRDISDANPVAEIKDIRKDIDSLKSNVVGLARHLRDIGADKAQVVASSVRDQADVLKATGAEALDKAEDKVRAAPAQSVAIAFAAGILASYLLGRRMS
jgi:ElaB/YqjD/DUF883 family membrane-anchored ribosome-binding protein